MKTKNEKFNELLNRFYENGVLKEVYASDKAIVCNVFNQFYLSISVEIIEWECKKERPIFFDDGYPAFVMNGIGLKQILRDDGFAYDYYGLLTKEDQEKSLRFMNERMLQHLIDNKDRLEKKLPQLYMDLEFERAVIEKGKGALDLFPDEEPPTQTLDEKPKKRGFFGLFK